MTIAAFAWLIAGLVVLIAGAELLVRGASRIALATGMSSLVVGLTVVALGTSSPELAISVGAAMNGSPDIALGNVVGSNIANVLLVLGIAALIVPLLIARQLIQLDVPVLVAASGLTWLLALDGVISRSNGVMLVIGGIAYTVMLVLMGRREVRTTPEPDVEKVPASHSPWKSILMLVAGLVLLVLGARWLVESAVTIAVSLGVSELVIGLTVIAVGTSLPEIATAILASLRGERDLAAGTVIGSGIYNLLVVLGATAVIAPGGIPVDSAPLYFDIPVMVATAVACLPIFFTGHLIARWEGALFLGYYAAYTAFLLMNHSGHAGLGQFSYAMLWLVIPLTVITLVVVVSRAWRDPHNRSMQDL